MRRICALLLLVVLAFSLCACAESSPPQMYIEKAQLTEAEQNIAELMGLNVDYLIYDFVLDESVKSMQLNTYQLVDGQWKLIAGGGGQAFTDTKGRIALGFDRLAEGMRAAIQSEHNSGAVEHTRDSVEGLSSMACATSAFVDKNEFAYEQEIPLVVQIISSKDEIRSYSPDYFFKPQEYAKHGYEYVYAVTVLFSQKTVAELESVPEAPAA